MNIYFFRLSTFVANLFLEETPGAVIKSVNSARFLQAVLQLCPHFKRCCSFNNPTEDWIKITDAFNNCIHGFWKIWLGDIKKQTEKKCIDLLDISLKKRVQMIIVSFLIGLIFITFSIFYNFTY